MEANFVRFFSPGTFVSEQTTKPIETWDVDEAQEMARGIFERYGATPYGFQFITRSREDDELDSHETAHSPMYYLGGEVLTLEQVKAKNDPELETLVWNMEVNKYKRVVINANSYKWTLPLKDDDVVLDWTPKLEVRK